MVSQLKPNSFESDYTSPCTVVTARRPSRNSPWPLTLTAITLVIITELTAEVAEVIAELSARVDALEANPPSWKCSRRDRGPDPGSLNDRLSQLPAPIQGKTGAPGMNVG